jgi:dihydropteroate synthase
VELLGGLGGRTAVMGVLNVTPDSFSDGGRFEDAGAAIERAKQMADEGADVIDVGGESTRPGASDVAPDEEIRRVVTVIEAIASLGPPVSVDTRNAAVAEASLDAGAAIVNDVSGGAHDEAMLPLVASRGADIILMHMRGDPATMDDLTGYDDVLVDVRRELLVCVAAAQAAGVPEARILVDPGLGFAKTPQQSLELLRRIDELQLGPVVVGPSRKRFVGYATGTEVDDRVEGTAGAVAWCAAHDVAVVRVHDVVAMRRVVDMIHAIRTGGPGGRTAESVRTPGVTGIGSAGR